MNGTDLAPLRARIAALVESGPIKADKAHRILQGEGWSKLEIGKSRPYVAFARHGEWWPWRMVGYARGAASRPVVQPASAPLAFPARKVERVGKCAPHLFTTTTQVDGQWLCELCKAQGEGVA